MKKESKEKHKLVISRKRWVNGSNSDEAFSDEAFIHGNNKGESLLLNDKNNMCCLGFFAKSCGLKPKNIRVGEPTEIFNTVVPHDRDKLIAKIEDTPFKKLIVNYGSKDIRYNDNYQNSSKICRDLIAVNDDPDIPISKREKKITSLFNKINVEVQFVD